MAFQHIKNVQIAGLAACVPSAKEENKDLTIFSTEADFEKFVSATGIERRRVANKDICSSDLCYEAAEKLIAELKWDKQDIECLIFVSQTPDYILPATACILQDRLNLSKDCMAFDVSLGCSGWVYGISVLSTIISSGSIKKGLLLSGDTVTKTKSPLDKSTYPLFGDAGTATAIEYKDGADGIKSYLCTDGSNYDVIMIEDGGYRNPVSPDSLIIRTNEDGTIRNKLQSYLDGTSVFTFGISQAPRCVKRLLEHFQIEKDEIDYYIFHQANMLMNEKIRDKLGLEVNKVPYTLKNFGNTSSASIPLTLVNQLQSELVNKSLHIVGCGFGVGLSWGAVSFNTDSIVCPDLIEI